MEIFLLLVIWCQGCVSSFDSFKDIPGSWSYDARGNRQKGFDHYSNHLELFVFIKPEIKNIRGADVYPHARKTEKEKETK